jgi:cyclohexanone monooxygenase
MPRDATPQNRMQDEFMSAEPTSQTLSAQEMALLEKYKAERAKRIRADGLAQYRQADGEFARFLDDPYAEAPAERPPVTEEADVVIIGGGWSGILAAVRLRKEGVDDIRIIDTAAGFGGVWYWNRYPGCRCDLDSLIYMPLLEETGYIPTEKYATADEIREHAEVVARQYDLYRHAVFQTQVNELRWDESAARWDLSTNRGDTFKARFVIVGNGPLNYPRLPAIPGIEDFKGHSFHTCRWDYEYTGGGLHGNLSKLKDKRVAVIGTGCSGVQCIPAVGASAKQLYVVQRTPAVVGIRDNKPTDANFARDLNPGWHRERMANFESVLSGRVRDVDLVADEWTDLWQPLGPQAPDADPGLVADAAQKLDIAKMEAVRARIAAIVKDPTTAESLKPYYNRFCKRPTFNDEYLPTFNRPNVKLIDTQGKSLEAVTENAFVFGGQPYEVDCIIYATGFEAVTTSHKTGGFEIFGRDGQSLDAKWATAVRSLHGIYSHGFPNLFLVAGLRQGAPTLNFPYMADEQACHAAKVVKNMLDNGVTVMEVTQEAEDGWCETIITRSNVNLEYISECTPGNLNAEGHVEDLAKLTFTTTYGGGPFEYIDLLKEWRDGGFRNDLRLE